MFTFDECELLNNFIEENSSLKKDDFIKELNNAKINTTEKELIEIADSCIMKLKNISEEKFVELKNNLPIVLFKV